MTIRIVTDSVSQIPAILADRYDIAVVPVTVVVDGVEYLEGVTLDPDEFWTFFADRTPEVSTSQPSPGVFIDLYETLIAEGATGILSVHVGAALSGTYNSARLAADHLAQSGSTIPIRLVDTETLSFGIACCAWVAGEALAEGASLEAAATAAEQVVPRLRSTFILQALDFTRGQGRLVDQLPADADGVPVFALTGADMDVIGSGRSVDELAEQMCMPMLADDVRIRVALCVADQTGVPFYEAMERIVVGHPYVVDVVRYRVGPSVGAYTGPGTAGGFWFPA